MYQQQPPIALNQEESKALYQAMARLGELVCELNRRGDITSDNARLSIRRLIKTHPVLRSIGPSESDLARLVSGIK